MNDHVRFGLLGCASIARRRTLPAMLEAPGVRVAAVASRSPDRASRLAGEFGGRPLGYEELLAAPDVDAVYVPVPVGVRAAWARAALDAGKHVLVEKPLAGNTDEARDLMERATACGLLLRENFMFLHHHQHAKAARWVSPDGAGALRSVQGTFCIPPLPDSDIRYRADLGGGALGDLGVYPIRAAQLFLGDGLRVAGAVLREDPRLGVDLSGQALLVSDGGVPATVRFGMEHSYSCRYELWGEWARLVLDRAFTPPDDHQPVLRVEDQGGVRRYGLAPDRQFVRAVGSFAGAVLAGEHAGSPDQVPRLASALRNVQLVDEIRHVAVRVPSDPG
ncbi:Gfo/Idh/MocA family protein [Nocardiopsis kunsanensis]|uniref:Gfo/Idh/MocA family protein n=1 Tax=Nocardiopsis kunsanensis TaxID=141693 RepID=UPI0005948C6E|nr:Gfo/Idh/MocA family oxidoreductase [Nocardiopsis kunsanensis]